MEKDNVQIKEWFQDGLRRGATHMIIFHDHFDHKDYPRYVFKGQNTRKMVVKSEEDTGRTVEIYDLNKDIDRQLKEDLAKNY